MNLYTVIVEDATGRTEYEGIEAPTRSFAINIVRGRHRNQSINYGATYWAEKTGELTGYNEPATVQRIVPVTTVSKKVGKFLDELDRSGR